MYKPKFSHRVIAVFLTLNFMVSIVPVNQLLASNNGPNAPEASGFEPVGATDMVNLSSGDMSYVLPLLEIDGFPVTLNYHAGIPMDMEASWVGLGWNINTGAIARGVVANPDDWGYGRRLNLTYLYGEIDSYSVNVGVGFAKAAEVGVGLSWGSNKSISGSVSASVGPLSASIDTNGNYSFGVSASAAMKSFGLGDAFDKIESGPNEGSFFGGSLSLSGNTKKGGISGNIGLGGSAYGLSAGMGISISSNGLGSSFSVGANNQSSGTETRSGGAGISMNSFSAGDYSYNTKGFYIPLQIGIFSFGFGHQKTEITLANGYNKYGYGILYHNLTTGSSVDKLYNTELGNDILPLTFDTSTDDYQRRNVFGDVYEQSLPQPEVEFIGDYREQIEKLNFTFGGYDSYDINASGIGGTLKPILGETSVLIGEGYDGRSVRTYRDKTKVFYHNSKGGLKPTKSMSQSDTSPNKLNFSFDGQITENAVISGASISNYTGSTIDISNFINSGSDLPSRPKSGSYVETYTNAQIDAGANIMIPASLKTSSGFLTRNSQGYQMEGIGGYKVTTPDGKTYHFAQPVYNYEQIQHSFLNFEGATSESKYNSSTKREATPYATHWLLTAITGPDYIDINGNNFADEDDYGYWLRLDHGQWSNAYTWRSPYDTRDYTNDGTIVNQARRHYSTFMDKQVEKSDPGYFVQGRKDLYYLDKIVSRNQSAIFVKDLRHDAYGSSADYSFNFTPNKQFTDKIQGGVVQHREAAIYDKEYQLKLDKIIIVNKPESEITINKTTGNGSLGTVNQYVSPDNRYYSGGFFWNGLLPQNRVHKLHLSDNIIDVNDVSSFDYSQANKVIKFEHSYDLAKKTPSSGYTSSSPYPNNGTVNEKYGRLTLESVKIYGRGTISNANENQLFDYMPPYIFDYYGRDEVHEENYLQELPPGTPSTFYDQIFSQMFPGMSPPQQYEFIRANKDNWGFRENAIEAWSLSEITTPQGSTIEVDYEEDDFYIEAFGRRYWENDLKFFIERNPNNNNILISIKNHHLVNEGFKTNFEDYFEVGEKVFIDLYICRTRHAHNNSSDRGRININSETYNNLIEYPTILSVDEDLLVIELNNIPVSADVIGGNDSNRVFNLWFAKMSGTSNGGTHIYEGTERNCPSDVPAGGDRHKMAYKLLSNKVAPGTSGGGLRVKDITVKDNNGGKYITRYDYTNPYTGKTSGITSFNPIRGEVFVPYQNELPGPGVMYEWVTMKAIEVNSSNNEREIASSRYHYYTLQPVFDIFNPNIEMKDIDGDDIFKTTVNELSMSFSNMTAKDMKIEKNLTKIGQLISIEDFNEFGHLMSKTTNSYVPRAGELSETYASMKTVFDFNEDDDGNEVESSYVLNQHYLGLSTKSEKVSMIKSIESVNSSGKSTITYSEPDEFLGTYTVSEKTLSDGTIVKEKKIPAYKKYSSMGSKLLNPNNKNMLTQEAMNITSLGATSNQTLNASITTWNNDWSYRDNIGNQSNSSNEFPVWRKHKTFIWKDKVNATTGTYNTNLSETNSYFNWGIGQPTNSNWQNVSEVTRYTHWSSPIESKDINNNYVSSKMADEFTKVIASGNARYTEMYYSGAEHIASGNYFEGEVKGANYQTNEVSHTGSYSVKNNTANDKVFEVSGQVSSSLNDLSKDFRPGKYKVSFWTHQQSGTDTGTKLNFNGIVVSEVETVSAGCWKMFNYYVELTPNTSFNLYATNTNGGGYYFDDFRMHPVYSSMNSFVYDKDTKELLYILDANNMSTSYRYDAAGRLKTTYKEVENTSSFNGGFKIVSQYKYHYKNNNDTSINYNEDINNCINQIYKPLALKELSRNCIPEFNTYDINYTMHVYDGSGNYKYEWKWLINAETGQYSNWIVGNQNQFIPYATKYCASDSFQKTWSVKARVTDLGTGEVISTDDGYDIEECLNYINNPKVLLGVEASKCHGECGSSKYQFHLHPLDANLSLPQTTGYIDNNTGILTSIDLSQSNGLFCPTIKYVETNECSSGYIQFVSITPTYLGSTGFTYEFYLDCVSNTELNFNPQLKNGVANDPQYARPGILIKKNGDGKIISITDTTKN
ncbi:hypothetical protein GCM10011531_27560 [Aquaticitalea lipolytica]|uniref:RHS repeat-associated core domain-containing protein n=1 Tax=Aquaticitalea lipolytica TaxID=1247562 RepID=A0A8J2TV01_9FLAO|nr:hypothetical protein [Aquaticitalea lipolytica]GFZ94251.1 hypothetical protein GCM10011531_27560 [Aquaticitalea lipolytica]